MAKLKLITFFAGFFLISFFSCFEGCFAEENLKLTARIAYNLKNITGDPAFAPTQLSVDRKHNEIYVVAGKTIVIFDNQGSQLFWFRIKNPFHSLQISSNGDIYIADNFGISIFNYRGVFKKKLDLSTIPNFESMNIAAIHIGQDDQIYIGDGNNGRIITLDLKGKFLHQFGKKGKGEGELFNFKKIATGKERIYILDPILFKISVFDKSGKYLFRFGIISGLAGGFSMPAGMVVHGGMIYVIDANRMVAIAFDKDGKFQFEFGGEEFGQQFLWPGDINVDNDGKIYVADGGNKMVQVFKVVPKEKK